MPRVIPSAVLTEDGYGWPIQVRAKPSIGLVAKAMALRHGRPDQRHVGKEHIRSSVEELLLSRMNDPGRPETEVPADVLRLWGEWLVERSIFPREALDESPDLA